jgi:uncharacterized protein (DUF2147 family)
MRLILFVLVLAFAFSAQSQAAETSGRWWTEDNHGVIAITPCSQGLCGRLVGMDKPYDDRGRPKLAKNGAPECGLQIMRVRQTDDPNVWDGTITDPRDMTDWNVRVTFQPDGGLHLRGYVLVPVLGESQEWAKFTGQVNAACEIGK